MMFNPYQLPYVRAFRFGVAFLLLLAATGEAQTTQPALKQRQFNFTYAATITGLTPGQSARIWLPVPGSSADQDVTIVSRQLPGEARQTEDAQFGDKLFYTQATAGDDGTIPLKVVYRITRREVGEIPAAAGDDANPLYLRADALVPIGGEPMKLLQNRQVPTDALLVGHLLYDVVGEHMEYRKDQPGWGRGDATWACQSGFGNCTDFHSLFISMARSEHIPAKFEIGFSIPEQRGKGEVSGYHCWAKFKPAGHGWVPVDISEADKNPEKKDYYFGHLCENRVAFSTGRDLMLSPRQEGPVVNFLVYPYVEVSGAPYAAEKIEKQFSYEDLN